VSKQNSLIVKARGLNTQPNELDVPEGSLRVAENVEITRDNVVQVSGGFEDYSSNLPDFEPQQLFAVGGTLYAHHDNGIWYKDTSSGNWLKKIPALGDALNAPSYVLDGTSIGYIYIVDTTARVFWKIDVATGRKSVLCGLLGAAAAVTDGTGSAARLSAPLHGAVVGTSVFFCDEHTIRSVSVLISDGAVTTRAGTAGATGTTDANGTSARFNTPSGICAIGSTLYIADKTNNRIRSMGASAPFTVGTLVTGLSGPIGICTDGTDLYVCDTGNHVIRKITTAGVMTTFAGTVGASGTTDATGSSARFSSPYGIAHNSGSLYVTDGSGTIRKIVISTAAVTTIAGGGGVDNQGIGTAISFASLRHPSVVYGGSEIVFPHTSPTRGACVMKLNLSTLYCTYHYGASGTASRQSARAHFPILGPD
jgi:hypothetical protein